MSKIKAIILDRDGVINYDSAEFIKSPEEWLPLPGSIEAIVELKRAGFLVAIATNQSGVGRGLFSLDVLNAIHQKMLSLLEEQNVKIDALRFCPHAPDDNCICRKPKPGMINDLLHSLGVNENETIVIGDAWRDIQAGLSAGCKTVLVLTGKGAETKAQHREEIADIECFSDLNEAAQKICATKKDLAKKRS